MKKIIENSLKNTIIRSLDSKDSAILNVIKEETDKLLLDLIDNVSITLSSNDENYRDMKGRLIDKEF